MSMTSMPVVITLSGTLTEGSEVSDVETVLMFIEETGTSEGFAPQAVTMDKRMAETTKIKLFFMISFFPILSHIRINMSLRYYTTPR